MAIKLQTSNEIIKYRALGFSYEDIANLTQVSKPVVIKVCRQREAEIKDAKRLAAAQTTKDVAEAVKARKVIYNTFLYKASSELLSRDLSALKVGEIAGLISGLERSLVVLADNREFKEATTFDSITDEQFERMRFGGITKEQYDNKRKAEGVAAYKAEHGIAD